MGKFPRQAAKAVFTHTQNAELWMNMRKNSFEKNRAHANEVALSSTLFTFNRKRPQLYKQVHSTNSSEADCCYVQMCGILFVYFFFFVISSSLLLSLMPKRVILIYSPLFKTNQRM